SDEYRTVPTDGTQAYWRDPDFFNWYGPAVAMNFAGGRYTFTAATLAPPIGPGITGAWFDPAQSGHGIFTEGRSDKGFLPWWFPFNPAGTEQSWFGGIGNYSGKTATITDVY